MTKKPLVIRYVVLMLCVFASGALLLHTSQLVQRKEAELSRFKNKLERERQMVGVLEAEWAQLNSPYRLEDLVQQHLDLKLPDTMNIAPDFEAVPQAQDAFLAEPEIEEPEEDIKINIVAEPENVVVPTRKPRVIPKRTLPRKEDLPIKDQPKQEIDGDINSLLERLSKDGGTP